MRQNILPAMWRKLQADIRSNKLQFLLIGGVLVLSAMLLTVSILVLGSADEPWDRTFQATNGPHLWVISHQYDLDFSPLTQDPAVSETSGVILALSENPLVLGDEKVPLYLYAMEEPPPVAHPLLAEGRWLAPANPGEIVLDFSLAKFYDFHVGDAVMILGRDGNHALKVVGLAVTAHWFPYNEITKDTAPSVGYISQATLEDLQPDPNSWYSVIGLRLKDPDASKEMTDLAFELLPGKLLSVIEWKYVKDNATLANTLNAMFMGLFSILGLAAVGMIIFNTIGGQVLSQYREIGLLKAIGFVPHQVTLLLLGEHLTIGLAAGLLGIGFGLALAPGLVGTMAENLNTTPPDIYAPLPLIGVLILVEMSVALATLLPAWQGGRIDTVRAITIGYRSQPGRVSHLGRLAGWLRLPSVVVLGVKDTFSRPLRAVLVISSLFLTVLVAITALGAQGTTGYLAGNRFYFNGTTADMKVTRNFVPYADIVDQIFSNPEIVDHYEELFVFGQVPGHADQPLGVRVLQGNYRDFEFPLNEGRMIAAPGEAVMGYAVLELLGASVGDTIEILVDGEPMQLTIVGRNMENKFLNYMVLTDVQTYLQVFSDAQPTSSYLRLKDVTHAEELRREWLDRFEGRTNVSVMSHKPVASVVQLTNLITSIAVILMVVAGANLMSSSLLSIRERVRDFGIQKTLGLTPFQITVSVVVGTLTLALFALVLGVTVGMVVIVQFIQQVGIAIGAGPDLYVIDWGQISLLLPILVIVAVLSSLLPAMRAARMDVTEALRFE